jgi:hypothetical protein
MKASWTCAWIAAATALVGFQGFGVGDDSLASLPDPRPESHVTTMTAAWTESFRTPFDLRRSFVAVAAATCDSERRFVLRAFDVDVERETAETLGWIGMRELGVSSRIEVAGATVDRTLAMLLFPSGALAPVIANVIELPDGATVVAWDAAPSSLLEGWRRLEAGERVAIGPPGPESAGGPTDDDLQRCLAEATKKWDLCMQIAYNDKVAAIALCRANYVADLAQCATYGPMRALICIGKATAKYNLCVQDANGAYQVAKQNCDTQKAIDDAWCYTHYPPP